MSRSLPQGTPQVLVSEEACLILRYKFVANWAVKTLGLAVPFQAGLRQADVALDVDLAVASLGLK